MSRTRDFIKSKFIPVQRPHRPSSTATMPQENPQIPQSEPQKRKEHTNEEAVLRTKIPRLDFEDKDPVPCDLNQEFDEVDQQNGLPNTVETFV